MELIYIPKANENQDNFPCWIESENPQGEKVKPDIICKCGQHVNIDKHWISKKGSVHDSFWHECGWHVHLILETWIRKEFAPITN